MPITRELTDIVNTVRNRTIWQGGAGKDMSYIVSALLVHANNKQWRSSTSVYRADQRVYKVNARPRLLLLDDGGIRDCDGWY